MTDKPRRKPISKDEKIAALLLTVKRCDDSGKLVPAIDREKAKGMTARQICEEFDWDHFPKPVTWGGDNHPTNLQPLLREDHRHKTAKFDAPAIAKVRRGIKKREREGAKLKLEGTPAFSDDEWREKAKAKARDYRREQYRKAKAKRGKLSRKQSRKGTAR